MEQRESFNTMGRGLKQRVRESERMKMKDVNERLERERHDSCPTEKKEQEERNSFFKMMNENHVTFLFDQSVRSRKTSSAPNCS